MKSVIKNFIIDLDGVMYIDDTPTRGSPQFIEFLRERKCRFLFLTNNSTKTRRQYVTKLNRMGIRANENEILTSSMATCLLLKKLKPHARVYAIGEKGLMSDLRKNEFILSEEKVDFVVVGLDREFNYEKISRACRLMRDGARFIATNPDLTFPSRNGVIPGAGTMAAAIEACSSKKPLIVGKPNPTIIRIALEMMGSQRNGTAILGDKLDTDILAAKKVGMKSILVLTGIETCATLKKSNLKPDYVFEDLPELMRRWPF